MSSRTILITGGNGGLGRAMALSFLEEDEHNVVRLGVNRRREHADQLIAKYPGRCTCIPLDVTEPSNWERVVADGAVDVLVNNAGGHQDGLLATLPASAWDDVVRTNLDAVFHGCQAVLKPMIARRSGRIINIASLSALMAPAGQANYAAAKAGVVALTQSLAKEVARLGITVNVVCPGYVDTEALQSWDD